eukprot:TRINITY_DN1957_c0_g1_i4.p1 TRINITY_DN1957_c0_g1~~TRINITY_DN1957_c0_g1_i4.p1  ORF type:complete len:592 (+),score=138.44 TRINITY_DN1957_c0_g1_i4:61-1836(+)
MQTSWPVTLFIYDLSQGMARQMSRQLVGRQIDGIWHTGVVVYGVEYYYGGGICSGAPKQTPYGYPVQEIPLGTTEIPQEIFIDFLRDISPNFTMDKYDLFSNNCNNFSDECSKFLLGHGIPSHITGLPQEFLQTPLGRMLKPMFDGMKNQMMQNSNPMFLPGAFEGQSNSQTMFGQSPGQGGVQAGGASQEAVVEVTSFEHFVEAMSADEGFIVDFYSYTCPPCMRIKPIYEQLASRYRSICPKLRFYKVNTQGPAREVAQQFEITSIPTFMSFYKGEMFEKFAGADNRRLESMIDLMANKIGTVSAPAPVIQSSPFKVFNPSKRELYVFPFDKPDNAINKIKTAIETVPALKVKDHTIFEAFAANPAENLKNFPGPNKGALVRWLVENLDVLPKEDMIPFYDLWRLLLADEACRKFYAKDFAEHFASLLKNIEEREIEVARSNRVFTYRAIANLFSSPESLTLIKTNWAVVHSIVERCLTKHSDDKTALASIIWVVYNVAATRKELELSQEHTARYLELVCGLLEREKDERVIHGAILSLIYFTHGNNDNITSAKSRSAHEHIARFRSAVDESVRLAAEDAHYILTQGTN